MKSRILLGKLNNISKIFILIVLVLCVLLNIADSISYSKPSVFSIAFLSVFILTIYFENYLSTLVLIFLNVSYCYFIFTYNIASPFPKVYIEDYTSILISFANNFNSTFRNILYKIINPLGIINNLLIWIIIIPFRINKFFFNKNVTT